MNPDALKHLPPTHPVAIFTEEHRRILAFLSELEALCRKVHGAGGPLPRGGEDEIQLARLAQALLDAEPHHLREETCLFPALEDIGISGPPAVMRMEHEHLRAMKHTLEGLGRGDGADDLARGRQMVDVGSILVGMLREHIAKEDAILYPMAIQFVDPKVWPALTEACRQIGPCAWWAW